jgi:hypothetical protein
VSEWSGVCALSHRSQKGRNVWHGEKIAVAQLRDVPGMAARALEFLALTAARAGEVIGIDWCEVDLQRRSERFGVRLHTSTAGTIGYFVNEALEGCCIPDEIGEAFIRSFVGGGDAV